MLLSILFLVLHPYQLSLLHHSIVLKNNIMNILYQLGNSYVFTPLQPFNRSKVNISKIQN